MRIARLIFAPGRRLLASADPPRSEPVTTPIRILLQTTIEPAEDDWSIARFSVLRDLLAGLRGDDGAPLYEVTARDRAAPPGADDPVLARIDESDFDELWLFAVDVGDGLNAAECAAISRFREAVAGCW